MREYRFRREIYEESGSEGWLLIGAPETYIPIGGMGLAHDIMEHRIGDTGSVEDELLALGAALYIRGEGGYWYKHRGTPCPGYQLSGDFYDLAHQYEGLYNLSKPRRTTSLPDRVENWIEEACERGYSHVMEYWHGEDLDLNGEDKDLADAVNSFIANIPGWLRRGYRMARRRYKSLRPYHLSETFAEIAEAADKHLKNAEEFEILVVLFDEKKGDAKVFLEEFEFSEDESPSE